MPKNALSPTQVSPAAHPRGQSARGPPYPVEQLLWGQDFAIFIQPEGGPELPTPPWWAWATPSLHPWPQAARRAWAPGCREGDLQEDAGTRLPVRLAQHQARVHGVEVSLDLPARCLGAR